MRSILDVVYNSFGQKLDIHLPEGEAKATFLYFHGGGLEAGSKNPNDVYHKYLTQRGICTVDVNYRMYPDCRCPDFIEDAADSVQWVTEHARAYGLSERLYVGGSSAGGYLSMMLCFDRHYLSERGVSENAVCGYVHDAGQPTTHFNVLRERGIDTRRVIVDEYAPLYHIGTGSIHVPDMLFIVSDNDMKNRYEQTMLTVSTLKHFGYDENRIFLKIMNGRHCEYVRKTDENGQSVLGKLVSDFIEGKMA